MHPCSLTINKIVPVTKYRMHPCSLTINKIIRKPMQYNKAFKIPTYKKLWVLKHSSKINYNVKVPENFEN